MEINPYNNMNNIQNLTGVQTGLLEKVASGSAINKASDDPSGMMIADSLGVQRSSLAQSVSNYNSGIAMSNIAQGGIASQKEILENIRTETIKAMNGTLNEDDRDAIAKQINKYIDQYDQIANSTNYNGQSLLKANGDETDDLSISGEDDIVNIEKADTLSISDNLKSLMSDFTTNSASRDDLLNALDESIDYLSSYASNYGSASNALESMARNAITAETNTASAQSTIADIDFAKEVSDFSKTNLQTQIGFLMQTQANAIQQKNIALLS